MKNINPSKEILRETGVLVFKEHCYALECESGTEYWLEMNTSPCHLIDEQVTVEGELHLPNIVSVKLIHSN